MNRPTPRPWKVIEGHYPERAGVSASTGLGLCVFSPEDAAHIVKCVNMHEELVDALSVAPCKCLHNADKNRARQTLLKCKRCAALENVAKAEAE